MGLRYVDVLIVGVCLIPGHLLRQVSHQMVQRGYGPAIQNTVYHGYHQGYHPAEHYMRKHSPSHMREHPPAEHLREYPTAHHRKEHPPAHHLKEHPTAHYGKEHPHAYHAREHFTSHHGKEHPPSPNFRKNPPPPLEHVHGYNLPPHSPNDYYSPSEYGSVVAADYEAPIEYNPTPLHEPYYTVIDNYKPLHANTYHHVPYGVAHEGIFSQPESTKHVLRNFNSYSHNLNLPNMF